MSGPLPRAGQNRPFPISPPCPQLQKILLHWGLKAKSFLCWLMLLLALNFLPQPLQTNTWPLCCQTMCLLGVRKDLKALSRTLQGWTFSLLCPPTQIPYTNNIDSLTNSLLTSSGRGASLFRCFLKLILVLKATTQLIRLMFLRAITLARWLSCIIFEGRLAPWTSNMCLDMLDFLEHFFFCHNWNTVLANRAGWQVAGGSGCWDLIS